MLFSAYLKATNNKWYYTAVSLNKLVFGGY